ncbi:MAG: MASE1 domain-containing protein [Myxococcaceae bacterium]|nr:MASE1 domain-containing protein [Myxococcaceae bacterium]MCI0672412.1 MASE1 domain-containing protein [Myxococcaceae bacterium]
MRRVCVELGVVAGVAGVYLALALLGLKVVVVAQQVSPVWPPAGFALAAGFILGRRAWPGVWMGALIANLSTGAPWPVALAIAVGNTLEVVVGTSLLRRAGYRAEQDRTRDVLALVVGPAIVGTLVSAAVGAGAVCASGLAPWTLYSRALGVWWVGDAMGVLALAPVLLSWRTVSWSRLTSREVDERALLLVLLFIACAVVFGQRPTHDTGLFAQAFLLFPFAIWAALRLRVPEAALVTLLISTGATVGTALGIGPFASEPAIDGMFVLQLFIAVLALTSLLLNGARVEGLAAMAQLKLLAAAMRSTEEGLLVLEPEPGRGARVLFANSGFWQMSGWTEAELQEGGLAVLVGASTPEEFLPRLEYAVREGGSFSGEAMLRRRDGGDFIAELQLSPVREDGEVATHFVATVRDVSEKRRLQEQLALSERMASVGRLAAGVAHEVNTPLAYVLTHLEALKRQLISAPLRAHPQAPVLLESVTRAKEGGERVRHIVRDLRVFARDAREERRPVDLNEVVETALTLTRAELRHRATVVQRRSSVPLVAANRARLEQVLVNLLMNAAQALPEGEAAAHEVEVRTESDASGRVLVVVRDTGKGIPAEHLPRIFEPFFTTKRVGEGMGLGLAICHEIISGLGGDISVQSTLGRGTRVTVALPAAADAYLEAALTHREPPPPAQPVDGGEVPFVAGAGTPGSPLSQIAPLPLGEGQGEGAVTPTPVLTSSTRRSVLVVDDEIRMGLSMQLLLQPDHDVATTTSAQEALDWILSGRRFDIIFCDLQMPHMSGMELHTRLREHAPDVAERMVFLTGGAFTTAAREFVRTVHNRVLEKPVPPDLLLSTISEAPGLPRSAA